ncbi:MAG TPA: ZIP family metal transporter [Gemmatimonadaceae bacterium]
MSRTELLYALAAGGANVLGALAVVSHARWSVKALDSLLSLAAGFMISVALVDLLPEAIARAGPTAAMVALLGYLLVHLTQHVVGRHFHFGEETHEVSEVVSVSALVGLLLHTFVDGVAMASSTQVSAGLGALVFIAVLLHKFPEGLAISSLFVAAGAPKSRAIGSAAILALATLAGVILTDTLAWLATWGLALSAGVTLYVGASNLVPEFQGKRGWRNPVAFFAGCALFFGARALTH